MKFNDFLYILIDNIYLPILIFCALCLFAYKVFKGVVNDLTDPLVYSVLMIVLGMTVMISLNLLYPETLAESLNYYLLEITFIASFIIACKWFKGIHFKRAYYLSLSNIGLARFAFSISAVLYLPTIAFLYFTYGIPIFSATSRMIIFSDSGILKTASDITYTIFVSSTVFLIFNRNTIYVKSAALLLFIILILSGSKGAFLHIIFTVGLYNLYTKLSTGRKVYSLSLAKSFSVLILSAMFFLIILAIKAGFNIPTFIYLISESLINRGDIFVYFYTEKANVINYLNTNYNISFFSIFYDSLARLRIIPWDPSYLRITQVIQNFSNPTDYAGGPNLRPSVFFELYFKQYAFFVSIFLGVFVAFLRTVVPKTITYSFLGFVFFNYLQLSLSFFTDVALTINNLIFNGVMTFCYMFVLVLAYAILPKKERVYV